MDDNFPRFQWSVFPNGKDGEQVVVRANNFETFVEDIEQVKSQFFNKPQLSRTAEKLVEKVENHTRVCDTCGSEMIKKSGDKNGKPWAGYFCSKKCGTPPVWIRT